MEWLYPSPQGIIGNNPPIIGSLSRALLFKAGTGETLVITPKSLTETPSWNPYHLLGILAVLF